MANWCDNKIDIYGEKQNILNFIERMKGKPVTWNSDDVEDSDNDKKVFTFNALWPVPEETIEVGYSSGHIKSRIRQLAKELGIEVPESFGFAMGFLGMKEDVTWIKDADVNKTIPADKYDDDKIVELLLLADKLDILDGYNWQILNWGTKWDLSPDFEMSEDDIYEDDDELVLTKYLSTAWSPPLSFFFNISPMFPDLKFRISYCEPGNNFSGIFEVKEGEILCRKEGSYGEFYGEDYDDEDDEWDEDYEEDIKD